MPKNGRPRIGQDRITFTVNSEQLRFLDSLCVRLDLSRAAVLRWIISTEMTRPQHSPDYYKSLTR